MRTYQYLLVFLLALCNMPCYGHNLQLSNVSTDYQSINGTFHNTISVDVSSEGNFGMSYAFATSIRFHVKYKNINDSNWKTVWFTLTGHFGSCNAGCGSMQFGYTGGAVQDFGTEDGIMSLMAHQAASGWADSLSLSLTMVVSNEISWNSPDIRVFAEEMIFQDEDEFPGYYLGDGTSPNRWHQGNSTTTAYYVDRSDLSARTVGTGANDIGTLLPSGIPVSTISYAPFEPYRYTMRYEITQKQYVDFLNCLSREAQDNRTWTDLSGTTITNVFVMSNKTFPFYKNAIRCDSEIGTGPITFYCDLNNNGIPNEADDGLHSPMNYMSLSDFLAYLDWAGLKPINEFQYEFYCRGSEMPVPGEYAWGTAGWTASYVLPSDPTYGTANESLPVVDGPATRFDFVVKATAAANDTTNRVQAGATATGMFEMTGNASEIVHGFKVAADFTAYPLADGDGSLDLLGNQNNGWPLSNGQSDVSYYQKGALSNMVDATPTTVSQRGGFWNTQNPNWFASPTLRAAGFGGRGGF